MNNLNLFFGEENFLLQKKLNFWKKEFKERQGDYNLSILDGEKESAGTIIAECETLPFLGVKRLVILENLPPSANTKIPEEKVNAILNFLENIPDSTVVLFVNPLPDKRTKFFKQLLNIAEIEEFNLLDSKKLPEWVLKEVSERKGKILHGAVPYLIEKTGNNLWSLNNEIDKLIAYCDEKAISENDIDKLVMPNFNVDIFKLTDLIGLKRTKEAIDILEKLTDTGISAVQIFNMIARQFRIFLQLNEIKKEPAKEIASKLGLHPFVVQNSLKQLNYFNENELKKALNSLLKIDIKLKTGLIKISADNENMFILELEKFIINFTKK